MLIYTRADLQRYVLRQQCLSAPTDSVEQAVAQILGLRAAEGSTPYLSLLWRVRGFSPAQFDHAVHQARSLLRVKGPRGTNFWVTPALAPAFLAAARTEPLDPFLQRWGLEQRDYLALEEAVTLAVGSRLVPVTELKEHVPATLQRPLHRRGFAPGTSLGVALEAMQLGGRVTLLKEPGFERHRSREYYGDTRDITRPNLVGLVAELYPAVQVDAVAETAARRELVRAYIKTYGPVTLADISWWTGFGKRVVWEQVRSLLPEVQEIRIAGLPGTFWVNTPAWEEGSAHPPDAAPYACLLPGGDSFLKGYGSFDRFLVAPAHDQNVLRFMPAALVDGLGRGNWAYRLRPEQTDVVVELFEPLEPRLLEPLRAAAHRVGQLVTQGRAPVEVLFQQRTGPWDPRAPFPGPGGRWVGPGTRNPLPGERS